MGQDSELTVSLSHDGGAGAPRRSPIRMPAPGDVVGGKYRIEEWLGHGGFGAVFRATQLVSEKPVALKWLLRPASQTEARARFLREARAAGRIHHPNVVDIYDVGQEAEGDFLVMELLRGESLRARLDRGALSVVEAVDLLLPAMLGVAAAHRAGVIHRDLKPDNVFLCERADAVHSDAKVLDFGISQITSADLGDAITRDGAVLGTPSYMSPEQRRDARNVDARTDVYAMGVVFCEALTGHLPVWDGGDGAPAQLQGHDRGEGSSAIPRAFEQVLQRAIARDRDRRYPDMESFVAAVRPFGVQRAALHGEDAAVVPRHGEAASPIAATPARTRTRSGRGRLAAAFAVALAALWLLVLWMEQGASRRPRSAVSPIAAVGSRHGPAASSAAATTRGLAAESPPAPELRREPNAVAAPRAPEPEAAPVKPARAAGETRPARVRPRAAAVRGDGAPVGRSGTISFDDM
jgi:serine/threonine-protein kinase